MSASQLPLPVNLVLFVVGAAAIWMAGRAATRHARRIAVRLRLGEAFVGMLCIATADGPTRFLATAGPALLALIYLGGIYALYRLEKKKGGSGDRPLSAAETTPSATPTLRLGLWFALSALGVFIGGFVVAEAASAIAEQSGLSETIVGASLVAISTSLPELTTTYAAVRLGAYGMAVGNILGTNALELALFLPADLIYRASRRASLLFLAARARLEVRSRIRLDAVGAPGPHRGQRARNEPPRRTLRALVLLSKPGLQRR